MKDRSSNGHHKPVNGSGEGSKGGKGGKGIHMNGDVDLPDHVHQPLDGCVVRSILGLSEHNGTIVHYCMLETGQRTVLPSSITNKLCPQLVIQYYEKRLHIVDNSNKPS
ncbi:uncharacterized protein LOC141855239 [Brevipalpus obovatus]|uniref:uncharacterized protein LOC141855239 n=1 Tax=Brevipalpus obovatus TaxID=246614 RepID=UPI003D9DDCB4